MQDPTTNRGGKEPSGAEDNRKRSLTEEMFGSAPGDYEDDPAERDLPYNRPKPDQPPVKPKESGISPGSAKSPAKNSAKNPAKNPAKKPAKKKKKHPALTVLRFVLVPVLCLLALGAGLAVGYTYIGDRPLSEAMNMSTWKHVWDLIFSE